MVFVRYIKASCSYLSSGITYFFVKKKTKEEHMANEEVALQPVESKSWFWFLYNWTGADGDMLRSAEKKILSYLKTAYRGSYVDIGPSVGISDKIWTLSLNEESKKTPILLLHGLASGVALWVLNLDSFAATRPVYAIDVLGFGRSSRPLFSSDGLEAEQQLVRSIEAWRKEMKLEKMILLGHSMGGFLAASYAIKYPDRVKHLILADPWGFPEKPDEHSPKYKYSLFIRAAAYILQPFNPLSTVRAAGPLGQWLIEKARPDIIRKFAPLLQEDIGMIPQYIFQCNAQKPSGESAFHAMMTGFGWAKHPIINRMNLLREDVPITLIYGARSWVDSSASDKIKELRSSDSYVNVIVINGAGHHVYADRSETFNKHVNEACSISDRNADVPQKKESSSSNKIDLQDQSSKVASPDKTLSNGDETTSEPANLSLKDP
ncbi:Abhydrolase domain-containing protein, putative [Pediculus humanus corporis]|uniref:1-acylglycerol-3-phosphate O-acyltransferase ABHD5 n=1 Tax=Pediculus humanus subsp. corporis TaxID=121224 RepID=E0VGB5_PEDHC|nr:Abhydrolase domain-containing protein, putative [Pediculus humanus corporis]EEB12421.1 Abhydrolase domain-containing protein, putative [Pediculus humanus corporis]